MAVRDAWDITVANELRRIITKLTYFGEIVHNKHTFSWDFHLGKYEDASVV
jgi:hypothetical protein